MLRFSLLLSLSLHFIAISLHSQPSSRAAGRPNIIFIMADDHAVDAISAYGSNRIQTPNIDRLAQQGMRFDRAFVTNSICAPSRAVILTGKHSHLNGVRDNVNTFDGNQQTFPKLLQQAGYQTAIVGKWHLKSEPTGFDFWKVLPGQGDYYQPEFRTPQGIVQEEGYVTDLITDEAIGWLGQGRDKSRPFLLIYQHKAPHREWWPSQDHLRDFKDKPVPEPPSLFDDYRGRGTAARDAEMRISTHMGLTNDSKIKPELAQKLGFEDFIPWYSTAYTNQYNKLTEEQRRNWETVYGSINADFEKNTPSGDELTRWKYQRYMQDYLASVQSVDDNIGRLLDYLEKSGLAENTLIIYTSDQGFYLGEHGWFDKRFMYEESFRTPLIVRWPGKVQPASANNDLVQNLDFAETILDAAGLPIPEDMQGRSLLPLLRGQKVEWRDALYYHYYEYPGIHAVKRHYGVRTERYKLIHFYYDVDEWELYDLERDPQELHNVIAQPEYRAVKEELLGKLRALQVQYGDSEALAQEILLEDLNRK